MNQAPLIADFTLPGPIVGLYRRGFDSSGQAREEGVDKKVSEALAPRAIRKSADTDAAFKQEEKRVERFLSLKSSEETGRCAGARARAGPVLSMVSGPKACVGKRAGHSTHGHIPLDNTKEPAG
ncbi:hypothetical protein AALO_G00198710 [Alosa alosa]|uniref:Uncharacterized protein n=1 Tax=Alosa alosa TaxID=278164 RepID=A0AAV6G2R4_9TELE|nr:hypothetical protein AALO_G00198710 [Alosa alosa]